MTHPVTLTLVEEQHLVGLSDRLFATQVPNVGTAIGKHEVRGRGALFRALVPTFALTDDVPKTDGVSIEQAIDGELCHGCFLSAATQCCRSAYPASPSNRWLPTISPGVPRR